MKASLILCSFAIFCPLPASAALQVVTTPSQVHDLAHQLGESKGKLVLAESQKRKILASIYGINKRMQKVTREKSRLTDERFKADSGAKAIAQSIAHLETRIGQQKKILRSRLRTMYQLSGESYLAILFSRESSYDFDRSLKFLKIVAQKDYDLINDYKKLVAEHQFQKDRLKKQVTHLVKIEKGIQAQEALLSGEQKSKSEIAAGLDRTQLTQMQKIKGIRQQTRDLTSLTPNLDAEGDQEIASLLQPSFYEKKGQLSPPVMGTVVQDFGLIQDDQSKVQLSHKGWYYSVVEGTPLESVFSGEVIYSDWIDGYGQTLVVDHGDHYYTIYAHTIHPKVKLGDHVATGQILAEAAQSAKRFGEGFYFEVRHFSEAEDPRKWLSSQQQERE